MTGCAYWCKPVHNLHGFEAVVNEIAASTIGQFLGAQVRPWKIIHVPPSLVGTNVGDGRERIRLSDKPMFGSLLLEPAIMIQDDQVMRFADDDENFIHIPRLVSLWLLCNAQDIQYLADTSANNSVWSIDHGFWFDSLELPWGFTPVEQMAGRPKIPVIKARYEERYWEDAIAAVDTLDRSIIDLIFKEIPPEWEVSHEECARLGDYVLKRCDYTKKTLEHLKVSQKKR